MFKNLFRIPDTFDADNRRRRQILNAVLIVSWAGTLLGLIYSFLILNCNCLNISVIDRDGISVVATFDVLGVALFSVLLFANRSPRVPSWIIGTILLTVVIITTSQVDTPQELYNGRSLVTWVVPIMLGAVLFRPGMTFAVTLVISGLMEIYPPPNNVGVNYY